MHIIALSIIAAFSPLMMFNIIQSIVFFIKEGLKIKKEKLTIEDRMLIDNLLKENYKLKDIARVIEVQPSTISREIKGRKKS